MKHKQRLYRVVTFLKREELDFLDKLAKDIYFAHGTNISRSRLIEEVIARAKDEGSEARQGLISGILVGVCDKLNRRKYPRIKKRLLVGLRKMDSLQEYQGCATDNVGLGGFKVDLTCLDKTLEVNQVIEVTLNSPEEKLQPLKAIGCIKWVREKENKQGTEIGVMLTYIRKEDRERFAEYLKEDTTAKRHIELKRRQDELQA